ncbi:MAG: zinc carboxypeptidase, partial [Paraburkholderia caledonica]
LDFLARAVFSAQRWLPQGNRREQLLQSAIDHWYRPDNA